MEYREDTFSTTNTKLAAVLMVFGLKLRQHIPLEWNDIFASKGEYLNYLNGNGKPKSSVSFNLDLSDQNVDLIEKIIKAFDDSSAEENFNKVVRDLEGITENQKQEILIAHSGAVAYACRDGLDYREFLIDLIFSVPHYAKWDVIRGNGMGELVRIGKNSSNELREEFLSKI